jgi:PhzF family phenazine biosynthesis protein
MAIKSHSLRVFSTGPNGGNPLRVILDAQVMTDNDMQVLAKSHGHECCFIFPAPLDSKYDYEFRFWVPDHEMEMCGHATVGAVWLLSKLGMLAKDNLRIATKSGIVEATISVTSEDEDGCDGEEEGIWVEVSQPPAKMLENVQRQDHIDGILSVLRILKDDLVPGLSIQNAATSRVKTLIPIKSVAALNGLSPQFDRLPSLCDVIGSTGLYPYAVSDLANQVFEARQFPRGAGYEEDAATGIAASALAFGLLENGLVFDSEESVEVKQGFAMGCPSKISVRFRETDGGDVVGCWIGGSAGWDF